MRMETYLKHRDKGNTLEEIKQEHALSDATVYTLELGYQCYLKKLPLDRAIEIIQGVTS